MSKVTVVLEYFVISVLSIRVIEQSSVYTSLSKQFHLSEHFWITVGTKVFRYLRSTVMYYYHFLPADLIQIHFTYVDEK